MPILLAVIDDLLQFVLTSLFGVLKSEARDVSTVFPALYTKKEIVSLQQPTTDSTSARVYNGADEKVEMTFVQGEKYFIGLPNTFLCINPVIAFDTASVCLQYGEMVNVLKIQGRWVYVQAGEDEGWVLKDSLREQASDVFPSFEEGQTYLEENPETHKLRLCLNDMFGGKEASLPLCDAEYVTYKLYKKGVAINWSTQRPRIAGTWQQKLRGHTGVHIGIVPKTMSVMEYLSDGIGHLCYVESVFPDESIKVSSIGLILEGQFTQAMMQKDEWKELRPVFITIT
jgi:hypothetical protein